MNHADDEKRLVSMLCWSGWKSPTMCGPPDNRVYVVGTPGGELRIQHLAESSANDSDGEAEARTSPAGWRAFVNGRRLCEGASWDELQAVLRRLPKPETSGKPSAFSSPFNGPFSSKENDERSTECVNKIQEVRDDADLLLGETGWNDEPTRTGFVARSAHYAKWGIPGQVTGWVGIWPTRLAAENELRQYANLNRR
ncbi:hypothetical protein [Saccharopolyspora shandongensis]|uniref:hypothetical protein n=1 Tax=Saccharopolyspora shandongensis TaxID=418495 RepID=UPI0033F5F2C1